MKLFFSDGHFVLRSEFVLTNSVEGIIGNLWVKLL